MKVIKRDDRSVEYNQNKIIAAINSANKNKDVPENKRMTDEDITKVIAVIEKQFKGKESIEVDEIQNIVEDALMNKNFYAVARAYIKYREERTRLRNKKLDIIKSINEKLSASNVQNQNANVDEHSFGGRKGEAESELARQMALDYYMCSKSASNHKKNRHYIHDLDSFVVGMHNCLSCPMDELLANGFITRQVFIRPANSLNTAMQLIAVIFQIQSLQQFGGVSATHLDWTMIPYVRKSFFKHYIASYLKRTEKFTKMNLMDIMFQDYEQSVNHPKLGNIVVKRNKFDDWVEENTEKCLEELGLKKEDFTFDNKGKLDKSLYQCALYDTIIEVKQAVEGLFHNLNSLQSRSGSQLPFSSVNYGTCTLEEGRLVTKAILETSIKGVGNGRTSIFPCQIFHYSKEINGVEGTPNYDLYKLALKSTSRRLYPNYANVEWSNQKKWIKEDREMKSLALSKVSEENKKVLKEVISSDPKVGEMLSLEITDGHLAVTYKEAPTEIFSTMGCRTINGSDVNFREEDYLKLLDTVVTTKKLPKGKIFSKAQKDGRGNIIPTTIILPTLAMEAKKKADKHCTPVIDEFFKILEKSIEDTKDELLERYKWICAQNPASARFMYENTTMSGYVPEEGIESALKHGTLVIGQLGMAETLQILVGCNQLKKKGMDLAKRIETMFNEKTAEYKKEYSLNFGVYYTPAENLCYTAMSKFKKKYGVIENVSDHDYFTNSIHVPVWEKVSPFEKIDTECQLTGFSNAGCITYVELEDSAKDNLGALEQIVNYAMEHDIPYFALNLRLSHCCVCGYDGYIENTCPCCNAKDLDEDGNPTGNIEQLARVTGYLSSDYRHFNKGKQSEVKERYKHTKEIISGWTR